MAIIAMNYLRSVQNIHHRTVVILKRLKSSVTVVGKEFSADSWTNVTPKVLSYIGRNLHLQEHHPLCLLKKNLLKHFDTYKTVNGASRFSVHENLSPLVTVEENFDSLLVPKNHVSRQKSDCYYIDSRHLLRGHTSAHQCSLLHQGYRNFLVVGDVYRRDKIDSTHFPVFHQMEGVSLFTKEELMLHPETPMFEEGKRTEDKQSCHSLPTNLALEKDLKCTLEGLVNHLFGNAIEYMWVEATFPFTHPSWELEVKFGEEWVEMLGCGIMEQGILSEAGVQDAVGWAFGLGLERLAMKFYSIPDIRMIWSTDPGFLLQFHGKSSTDRITFKPVSVYPPCVNDISFWLPEGQEHDFASTDFYDLVRTVGGDLVEQVQLKDEFVNPKNRRVSHCYRIVYRHLHKTLTQDEVNAVHRMIEDEASKKLQVSIR